MNAASISSLRNAGLSDAEWNETLALEAHERALQCLFSSSQQVYGGFKLHTLKVELHHADEVLRTLELETKRLRKVPMASRRAQVSADLKRYLQTWAHEYFHLLQAIRLNAVRAYVSTRRAKTKLDIVIALKFLESGGRYELGRDVCLRDPMRHAMADSDLVSQCRRQNAVALFYANMWTSECDGLSTMHIVEGMAHQFSLHLTSPNDEVDHLGLPTSVYGVAWEKFVKFANCQLPELICLRPLFCYICWFALSVDGEPSRPDTVRAPVETFRHLAFETSRYLAILDESRDQAGRTSTAVRLRRLKRAGLGDVMEQMTNDQQATALAFLPMASAIKRDAYAFARHSGFRTRKRSARDLDAIQTSVTALLPKLKNDEVLWILMVAPDEFFRVTATLELDKIEYQLGDSATRYDNEVAFYELFDNMKAILDSGRPAPWCCERHGYRRSTEALRCKNEASFAHNLSVLFQRPIDQLFI